MTLPVKPINEIEVKSEVSINDKILILDSESEEARLASKDELKGDKGDKGDTWDTWPQWPQWIQGIQWPKGDKGDKWNKGDKWDTWNTWPTWPKWDKWDKWDTWAKWDKGDTGATWPQWATWPKGNWITTVTTSKSWKTTTVTMNYDSWSPTVFQVQDGADGQWSGDMNASTYDPTGKKADAFDYDNMYNTPTIPSTAADVWALPDTTKYWANLSLTINSSTYVVTAQLKDQNWNNLWTAQTIDLPLESVVVSGSYDSATKKVVLTLQSGSTIEFSVADLVAWLQSEITSTNKLDSDLVDDTNQTNKFVTAAEKSTWSWKQDAINDLTTIRNGASAWATAVHPWDDVSELNNDAWYITAAYHDSTKQDTLVSGTNIKTINSNSILWSGNLDIDWLPSQTGQSWKYLTTDWTTASWGTVSGGITNDTTWTTSTVTGIWAGSEAEYWDLSQKDSSVLYFTF